MANHCENNHLDLSSVFSLTVYELFRDNDVGTIM